jgi:hypothetical protein
MTSDAKLMKEVKAWNQKIQSRLADLGSSALGSTQLSKETHRLSRRMLRIVSEVTSSIT